MVLIISDNNDQTTNLVIDWLHGYGAKWFRLNETDRLKIISIKFQPNMPPEIILSVNDERLLNFDDITSYWYRRGTLDLDYHFKPAFDHEALDQASFHHCQNERNALRKFIFDYLTTHKKSLGSFEEAENKKLIYLGMAQSAGLVVPQTLICDHALLTAEFGKEATLITKSIHETIGAAINPSEDVYARTFEVNPGDVMMQDIFFPSLFQHNIRKWIELRIFFIRMDFYTMAIFSQDNEQTQTDFRNYDMMRPNRNVPFKLPDQICEKLRLFVYNSKLSTGSIDMIVTPEQEYVFLEVNPVGQFEMVSYPCNYYLEQKVAQFLTA